MLALGSENRGDGSVPRSVLHGVSGDPLLWGIRWTGIAGSGWPAHVGVAMRRGEGAGSHRMATPTWAGHPGSHPIPHRSQETFTRAAARWLPRAIGSQVSHAPGSGDLRSAMRRGQETRAERCALPAHDLPE